MKTLSLAELSARLQVAEQEIARLKRAQKSGPTSVTVLPGGSRVVISSGSKALTEPKRPLRRESKAI